MYPIIIITILCATFCICPIINQAQTFAEWWQQKKTRIQYLQQQAAALAALKKTVEKGYQIAEDGIQDIRNIKEDEFGLHSRYFHSMEVASPAVTNSPELSACLSRLRSLLYLISDKLHVYSTDPRLKPADQIFYMGLFNCLMTDVQEKIEQVHSLVTDYQLKMTDGERLLRIKSIEERAKGKYKLAQSCSRIIDEFIQERQFISDDIKKTLHLYQ
jgi:hypothetical protein